MKRFPQIDRFFTAVCSFSILALLVLLSSCEKDSLQDDSLRIKASNVSAASFVAKVYDNSIDCNEDCIVEGSGEYYVKSNFKSEINGSNEKKITYYAYNTETEFFVKVKYENTNSVKADITIDIMGDIFTVDDVEDGDNLISHSMVLADEFPNGWEKCEEIKFSINATFNNSSGRGASQNDIDFVDEIYSLIGICSSTCDESFSYVDNQDGSYTFTYVSSEDLNGADVKFTCPHITGFEVLDGKEYEVNPGNSKGSPTVLTWTGDIQACTEITFTLAFDSDCDQTNSGKANLFTDFKVNGESKKGDNGNIVYQCPN